MRDAAAETATKAAQQIQKTAAAKAKAKDTALDRRYGAIGISAVAAAARYQGDVGSQKSEIRNQKSETAGSLFRFPSSDF